MAWAVGFHSRSPAPLATWRGLAYGTVMDSEQVLAILRGAEARLHSLGVRRAALFGSTARGEARPGSDLDIMIEIDPAIPMGVFEYVGIVQALEHLFPVRIDVSNRAAQKDHVRASAARDAVYAF